MAPQSSTPTSVSGWKRDRGTATPLPSGNIALLKRPGMEKLFTAGVLPDELTKIALEHIARAERGGVPQDFKQTPTEATIDPKVMEKFLESENAITEIFMAFDRVTEMCVLEPPVKWHMRPIRDEHGAAKKDDKGKVQYEEMDQAERDAWMAENGEVLWTDEVDPMDKEFIFNVVVGGTDDLESFREKSGDALATVRTGEDVGVSS